MTMLKRVLWLLLTFSLLLSGCGQAFAQGDTGGTGDGVQLEDKNLYKDHPLYVELDLNPNTNEDDGNFAVMQEGSVILYGDSSMRMDVSEDRTSYTLYHPNGQAQGIAPGTPVAFIDQANLEAFFFLPTQVTAQSDCIVFSCSPDNVEPEQLFYKVGLSASKLLDFNKKLSYSNPAGTLTFSGDLSGQFYVKASYNLIALEAETWVSYDLNDAELEVKDNFSQEIPIAKIPFTGIPYLGPEIGVGLGLAVEGDTKISFDLTGGKAGFKGGVYAYKKPVFSNLSEKPGLNITEIIAEGGFEVDLTLGPSIDVLSVAGVGCDIAAGISIAAELTGDEGGRPTDPFQDVGVRPINPNVWHVCKELSCLQGEIDLFSRLEAWIQVAGHVSSVHYDLFREKYRDFHYSFTFNEFKLEPCDHYLYQVSVKVEETANTPMKDVTVTYADVPPMADRRGKSYIEGVTGEDGYVHLYMPKGDVKITATSWQDDPDQSSGKVKKTTDYTVIDTAQGQEVVIQLPLYHYMVLVYFEENAGGHTVENMPNPFLVEQNTVGTLPNEVPQSEGLYFAQWNTQPDGTGDKYFPGDPIPVGTNNIPLFAIWTTQPVTDFRTITYVANGDNVVMGDNPQSYTQQDDGTLLINPTRKDYVFIGWTCDQIGLTEPDPYVVVQWNGQEGNDSDYVNRTYVANWKHETYNVIWRNWDGSWLDITRDVYDVLPVYEGSTPQRPSDDSYFYVFSGWTPEIKVVNADAEYTAVYSAYPLLKITSSPADQSVLKDKQVTFAVEATGGVQPLSYQWYLIPAGQTGAGSAINGANSASLTVTSDYAMSGNQYYCVVQDKIGQRAVSETATLTVTKRPLVLLFSPEDASLKKGETATFAVGVSGGEPPLTYQWYVIPAGQAGEPADGAGMALDGAKSATLTVTAETSLSGNRYYCVVQDTVGQRVVSKAATLTVDQPALILVSSPKDVTCMIGESATFTVSVSGGVQPYTYQWYVLPAQRGGFTLLANALAEEGTAVAGAVSNTLTVTASTQLNGNRYYCVVRDDVGQQVVSQSAILNVVQPAPQTGDDFPLLPLLMLLLGSGAVLLFGFTSRRKGRLGGC